MQKSIFEPRTDVKIVGGKRRNHNNRQDPDISLIPHPDTTNDRISILLYRSRLQPSIKNLYLNTFLTVVPEKLPPVPVPIMLNDIQGRFKYVHNNKIVTNNLHQGQLKLFLGEVQFLTNAMRSGAKNPLVIYAGAAPSNHTYYLSRLFPTVKFFLVDPNRFDLKVEINGEVVSSRGIRHDDIVWVKLGKKGRLTSPDQVNIKNSNCAGNFDNVPYSDLANYVMTTKHKFILYEDYMTVDLAEKFRAVKAPGSPFDALFFISDIRTNSLVSDSMEMGGESPTEADVVWNLSQQHNWLLAFEGLNKKKATQKTNVVDMWMLKFRQPFDNVINEMDNIHDQVKDYMMADINASKRNPNVPIDFLKNWANCCVNFQYLDGDLYLQAYPGIKSTEVRLVSKMGKPLKVVRMDYRSHEEKCFYNNLFRRSFALHENKSANKEIGFDHCFDCALHAKIFEEYIKIRTQVYGRGPYSTYTVLDYVKEGIRFMNPLRRQNHGNLFPDARGYNPVYADPNFTLNALKFAMTWAKNHEDDD